MANTKRKKAGEEDRKIQVLTVLRNGAILNNIFVTIEKASPTSSEPSIENEENIQETEEILTCDRHSDCNIDENLMANERESVEKKGSLEVAGKDDEQYQERNYDIESSFRNDHKVRDKLSPTTGQGVISGTKCQEYAEHTQSPGYFSFPQELPETESEGSSMIRESNVEFFSTRTPLSTARLEAHSASEMLGATENGSILRKGHEPINIFSLGIEMVSLSLPIKDLSEYDKRKKPGEEERKIQVLTVLRNGAILKNIFVTIEKASPTSSEPSIEKEENIQETEEILTCGRHPDCNIDVGSLYCDEICESIAKKEISSAALVLDESMDSLFYDAEDDILRHTTSLISSCSDDHAANDVLEVENHDFSRDDCGHSEYTSICSELVAQESVSSSCDTSICSRAFKNYFYSL
ncbi:hypothetical protein SADUNF_Sadunf17G0076800 [Salix dunnii]|uniref:Uncharacterized protein n=1 Tax=Salix dunnii TaxID=1413687 RepID=A0A835J5Z2_9ROSI|nr:hypothetical protein SADUNF_Sadunf17G0076800 [Salix dunnii]